MAEQTQLPPTHIEIRADPIVVVRPTRPHTINTRTAPALPLTSRISCTLNLFFDSASKTAFLRFRLLVPTDQQGEPQPIYILVWPEQITLIAWENDEVGVSQDSELSRLCQDSRGTFRLRIELSRAGSVVGPRTWAPSTSRLDAQAYDDVQWLGKQTQLTLYIGRRAMSAAQLRALCSAASTPGLLKASPPHADITQLYVRQGGKILENFTIITDDGNVDENDISTESGSPPSYDEAAAGPAGPPGPEQHPSHKPSVKRRRPSSSLEPGDDTLRVFQDICNKVWDDRRDELFTELTKFKAQIMDSVEERLSQLQNKLTDRIEQVDGNTVTVAGDLVDEALDDKMTSIKVELEDFVRDELRELEGNIWDQLEAGTWETSFMRRQGRQQT